MERLIAHIIRGSAKKPGIFITAMPQGQYVDTFISLYSTGTSVFGSVCKSMTKNIVRIHVGNSTLIVLSGKLIAIVLESVFQTQTHNLHFHLGLHLNRALYENDWCYCW